MSRRRPPAWPAPCASPPTPRPGSWIATHRSWTWGACRRSTRAKARRSSAAPYTFSSLTLDPGLAGGLVPGLPDNGLVYLIAYVTTPIGVGAATVEVSIENNGGGASATYPTGPADPSYDVSSDGDQDGWEPGSPPDGDCNDANPAVHPGVPEIPNNGIDEDCTGGDAPPLPSSGEEVPGWDLQPGYEDDDGDGYPANTNYYGTPIPNDCNDGSATTHPGAEEIEDNSTTIATAPSSDGEHAGMDWQTLDFDGSNGYSVQNGYCNGFLWRPESLRRPSRAGWLLDNDCDHGLVDNSSVIPNPQPSTELVLNRSGEEITVSGGDLALFYEVTRGGHRGEPGPGRRRFCRGDGGDPRPGRRGFLPSAHKGSFLTPPSPIRLMPRRWSAAEAA